MERFGSYSKFFQHRDKLLGSAKKSIAKQMFPLVMTVVKRQFSQQFYIQRSGVEVETIQHYKT